MPRSRNNPRDVNQNTDLITAEIVDAAVAIHRGLGPGLLESVYERVLARDLERRGLHVQRQVTVSFEYDGPFFDGGLTLDLLVNDCVVVELKAVEQLLRVHSRQTFTCLRLLEMEVALLLNFGAPTMKEGVRRIVHDYRPTPQSTLRINTPT